MFSWAFDLYYFVYVNESDLRSNVHYLGSSENKAWSQQANWELVMMLVLNKWSDE